MPEEPGTLGYGTLGHGRLEALRPVETWPAATDSRWKPRPEPKWTADKDVRWEIGNAG